MHRSFVACTTDEADGGASFASTGVDLVAELPAARALGNEGFGDPKAGANDATEEAGWCTFNVGESGAIGVDEGKRDGPVARVRGELLGIDPVWGGDDDEILADRVVAHF